MHSCKCSQLCSLQYTEDMEISSALAAEEKLVFGIHAHAVSQMTVLLIRKNYSKVDSKSIAKQVSRSLGQGRQLVSNTWN